MSTPTSPITDAELEELKRLHHGIDHKIINKDQDFHVSNEEGDKITAFWVALHNTFPHLLARLSAAEARNTQLCRELEAARIEVLSSQMDRELITHLQEGEAATASQRDDARASCSLWEKHAKDIQVERDSLQSQLSKAEEEKTRLISDITALQTECDGLRITRAEFKKKVTDVVEEREKLLFHINWYLELTTTRPDGSPVKPLVPANRSSSEVDAAKLTLDNLLKDQPLPQTEGREDWQDTKRLDRLEAFLWSKHVGNGAALWPGTKMDTGERIMCIHDMGDEDGSNLGEDFSGPKESLRAAIDALPPAPVSEKGGQSA